jgi:hypothetical protein
MRGIRSPATSGVTTESFIGTKTEPSDRLSSRRAIASEAVVCAPLTIWRSVADVMTRAPPGTLEVVTVDAVAATPLLYAKNFCGYLVTVWAIRLLTLLLRPRRS